MTKNKICSPENEKKIEKSIKKSYIMSCDIGTSSLRCIIYDENAQIIVSISDKLKLLCPQPGFVEIDPTELWEKFIHSVRKAIESSNLTAANIRCMGLSTQRASFLLWDKRTGEPLHNFVTWKDIRADAMVQHWNKSFVMKAVRLGTGFLYHILRKKRYQAASILKFQNNQVNMRLKWVLENDLRVKQLLGKGVLMFGTVDTWLIYKLTGNKVHATDPSNASGTAIYDPYLTEWSSFLIHLLRLPRNIFPEIRDSVGFWGETDGHLFNGAIPITAVISDQGAAMFGGCGFQQGDVKITLGTGAFLDLNTGNKPHTSLNGIYPVIGWKGKRGIIYMAEGSSNDNGTIIQWGKDMNFYERHSDTSEMAESVKDSGGVYFVPSFQGLQAPINDAQATGGFIGLTNDTRKEHLVRAMLESLGFRAYQIYLTLRSETNFNFLKLRVDGGVAQNNFLMQMISTLTEKTLERPKDIEESALGCCFLAGLGAGVWKDEKELEGLRSVERTFEPRFEEREELLSRMKEWERAVDRFKLWYPKKKGTKNGILSWNLCLQFLYEEEEEAAEDACLSSSSLHSQAMRAKNTPVCVLAFFLGLFSYLYYSLFS